MLANKDFIKILTEKLYNWTGQRWIISLNKKIGEKTIFEKKNESKINWNNDAKNINAKIKGLYPSPGAWFEYKNERYKILESEILNESGIPGQVLDDFLTIACNRNSIRIKTLQRQGKKPQATKDFLLGNRISKGTILNCD